MASEYRLGKVQAKQFHSGTEYGTAWVWTSKCYDDAETGQKKCDDNRLINAYSEMPREYSNEVQKYGSHYNIYSASAETMTYSNIDSDGEDSICPTGWELPSNNSNKKTWFKLGQAYGILSGYSAEPLRKYPLSLVYGGAYRSMYGNVQKQQGDVEEPHGDYWTSSPRSTITLMYTMYFHSTFGPYGGDYKTDGFSIRCVRRD